MFRRASRGFGLPDCGLAAQLAIQVFVEPLTGPRTNKKRLRRTQIRSVFITLTRGSGSYFISENLSDACTPHPPETRCLSCLVGASRLRRTVETLGRHEVHPNSFSLLPG